MTVSKEYLEAMYSDLAFLRRDVNDKRCDISLLKIKLAGEQAAHTVTKELLLQCQDALRARF
jgi:hypothetical protein